jgi:hypothetical protein
LELKVTKISNDMFVTLQLGRASYDDVCKKNPQLSKTKLLLIYKSCQFSGPGRPVLQEHVSMSAC